MTTEPCYSCSGSGLELAANGDVTGRCYSCKGSRVEPCPKLNGGSLVCNGKGHPHAHTYDSSSVPDGHDDSEARAEATR